jgi:hypothetical protein
VRVAYSDTPRVWHEVPTLGTDDINCAIAPLSETSALLVYAGGSGLAWARLEGAEWVEHGVIDPNPWHGLHPRFAFRPSGGLWLFWTTKYWAHVSSYRDGVWSRGDSLQALHPPGETFWSAWGDMSRDHEERPLLAWGDLGYGYTYRDVACVSFPTETGWATGEEVPGSDGGWDPTVTRDRNGDAWVAWWPIRLGRTYWNHTYVSATASEPSILGVEDRLVVSWTLSEPAPGSYWAVLRAEGDGEFVDVARVRADSTVAMSWNDATAPQGQVLRYRIRRESVDTRYEWLSDEAVWAVSLSAFGLMVRGPQPVLDLARMQLIGAVAGPAEVQIYDVQGRRMWMTRLVADGTGRDDVQLDMRGRREFRSGLYFVRAVDASGRMTPAVKLAVLR